MAARATGPQRWYSFSPVMAIGILSVAAGFEGWNFLSGILLVLTALTFLGIVLANLAVAAPAADFKIASEGDAHLALVLFTWVAACGVLGERMASLVPRAELIWMILAVAGWVVGVWAFARALGCVAGGWRRWEVSGSWLLAVVAPQSLSILASWFAARTDSVAALGVSVAFWALGIAVYCGLIGLIIRRVVRAGLGLDRLTPDYWITMGALAISTVAALDLSGQAGYWRQWLVAFAGATFICSALWVPLLVGVEIWQIGRRGLSFSHDILRWSTVFPLGMFSVASFELAYRSSLSDLIVVAQLFFWVGLAIAVVNAAAFTPAAVRALGRIV